jgi:hypothetical protein
VQEVSALPTGNNFGRKTQKWPHTNLCGRKNWRPTFLQLKWPDFFEGFIFAEMDSSVRPNSTFLLLFCGRNLCKAAASTKRYRAEFFSPEAEFLG